MEEKKKRGSNYTAAEQEMLLEGYKVAVPLEFDFANIGFPMNSLHSSPFIHLKRYQNIIENKETNTHMITKKRNTSDSICQQYNAIAVSGFRTWQQLRHLYENLKQRSKKKIANENRLQFYEKTKMKEVQKKASIDKKEINHTGGGAYKSTLTGQDVQILAMAGPQIKPLPNPYDDAALYFGDVEVTNETEREVETPPDSIGFNTGNLDEYHTTIPNITMTNNSKKPCTVTSNFADDEETTIRATTTATINQECDKTITTEPKRQGKPKQKENCIQQQYFKLKLRNAKLENKYLINRSKMEMNKYKIDLQILKLRLKKLASHRTHYGRILKRCLNPSLT